MPCSSLPSLVSARRSPLDDEATERDTCSTRAACECRNICPLDVRMSLSSVCLSRRFSVALDTFWRARIDLCMHRLVQPQTHLPIHRSILVYTSSRSVFEALDQQCNGHAGLPHAVLTADSVRHVCLSSETIGEREEEGELVVKTLLKSSIPSFGNS